MIDPQARGIPVTSIAELEAIVGPPAPTAANKTRDRLHEVDLAWLAAAPLAFVATSDEHGNLDVSPKGDPAGFAVVLDDRTVAVPERAGNRRVDGFRNLLANPHVGLLFAIPGRGDTLRINGRATIVRDAPFFDDRIVKGNRPLLAIVVDIDEVFFHCSRALLRSQAWQPETWNPEAAPRRAVISKAVERQGDSLEELDAYYGPSYADRIYG
ncbi:MSMEG_1061 family FMN-dependent PPOX-type flavoprotein [Agromyces sp. NPDC058136]|uniref:MSMEG_1061 family FMN-dependent PPOX-type flavoprotein n=1 Tax=Agromyces sp. NPDC058136 TaxID=3346354 RepID=UPI0036DC06DA